MTLKKFENDTISFLAVVVIFLLKTITFFILFVYHHHNYFYQTDPLIRKGSHYSTVKCFPHQAVPDRK